MRVDATRGDDTAGSIDLTYAGGQTLADLDDAATDDADVGIEGIGGRGSAPVAHDEVEGAHRRPACAPISRRMFNFSVDNALDMVSARSALVP